MIKRSEMPITITVGGSNIEEDTTEEKRWVPYAVINTKAHPATLLIHGGAWTALVTGSKSSLVGAMRLAATTRKIPELGHSKRCLRTYIREKMEVVVEACFGATEACFGKLLHATAS